MGVRIAGHKPHRAVHKPDGGTGDTTPGVLLELRGIEAVVEEMSRQGFVYILLDMGELERLPRPPQELKRAMGERTIAVASAASLAEEAGAMVRDRMMRQFLLQKGDIFDLDARELAEEIVFLRDNRTGPIASGNLVPLLSPDPLAWGEAGLRRVRAVLAACRLVLGDVFLPAPPSLWKSGETAGANLWILDTTGRPLAEAVAEAEGHLGEMALAFKRTGRGDDPHDAPGGRGKA